MIAIMVYSIIHFVSLSRIYTSKFSLTSFPWQGRLARADANFSLSRKTCSCRWQKIVNFSLSRKTCQGKLVKENLFVSMRLYSGKVTGSSSSIHLVSYRAVLKEFDWMRCICTLSDWFRKEAIWVLRYRMSPTHTKTTLITELDWL